MSLLCPFAAANITIRRSGRRSVHSSNNPNTTVANVAATATAAAASSSAVEDTVAKSQRLVEVATNDADPPTRKTAGFEGNSRRHHPARSPLATCASANVNSNTSSAAPKSKEEIAICSDGRMHRQYEHSYERFHAKGARVTLALPPRGGANGWRRRERGSAGGGIA